MQRLPQQEIELAVEALRAGELVAFPTETVYGLGANANNPAAVRRIYEVKGRPADHPLIVHLDDVRYLPRWVREMTPAARALADAFWPGPLTLVLMRAPAVNDAITGGQETIAVRVPGHPVAQQLLKAFGGGIAAPSANRYGQVSPTRAEHVREEFGDEVAVVLDGGDCRIGLESTIVDCTGPVPRLLRPGSITISQLRAVVPDVVVGPDEAAPRVPGRGERHYSPKTPVTIVSSRRLNAEVESFTARREKVAVLAQRLPAKANRYMTWLNAGARPETYARQLYANLRKLDKAGAAAILVEEVPEGEAWDAVRDRLQRAASARAMGGDEPEVTAHPVTAQAEGRPLEAGSHGPIVWVDLTVNDAQAVRDFYASLTGLSAAAVNMGAYEDFNLCDPLSGRPVAGLCHRRGPNKDLPPVWLVYFRVADLESALAVVKQLGGTVLKGPVSMGDQGRYAVIRDPAGAHAGLFEPVKPEGVRG